MDFKCRFVAGNDWSGREPGLLFVLEFKNGIDGEEIPDLGGGRFTITFPTLISASQID